MRSVILGSFVTLILSTGLLVSQVEAKNDDDGGKGKDKFVYQFAEWKNLGELKNHDDHGKGLNKFVSEFREWKNELKDYKTGNGRSVPIPGTLLFMGGGFAGLMAWRALRRKSRD